jgi:hypothetical protein
MVSFIHMGVLVGFRVWQGGRTPFAQALAVSLGLDSHELRFESRTDAG